LKKSDNKNTKKQTPSAQVQNTAGKPLNKAGRSTKKKQKSKIRAALSGFLIFAALVVIVVFIAGAVSPRGSVPDVGGIFSIFAKGAGYPYSFENSGNVTADRFGSGIMLLGEDSFKILNSTAKEVLSVQHNYSNPDVQAAGGRVIIFDRASGQFKVVARSGVVAQADMEKNILTAAMGKNGSYAVATKSLSAQSELTVFEKSGKKMFVWACAAERISAVALSDDGKHAVVSVIGAKNAELYSRLIVFDFKKSEPMLSLDYPETALFAVGFAGRDKVVAIGENLYSFVSVSDGSKQDYSFGMSDLISYYISEKGKTALVVSSFGSDKKCELLVYNPAGERLITKSFEEDIRWVACDEKYVCVLLPGEARIIGDDGESVGSFKADKYSESVAISGRSAYLFEKSVIYRYNALGSNE
jgi:hypothetical protein